MLLQQLLLVSWGAHGVVITRQQKLAVAKSPQTRYVKSSAGLVQGTMGPLEHLLQRRYWYDSKEACEADTGPLEEETGVIEGKSDDKWECPVQTGDIQAFYCGGKGKTTSEMTVLQDGQKKPYTFDWAAHDYNYPTGVCMKTGGKFGDINWEPVRGKTVYDMWVCDVKGTRTEGVPVVYTASFPTSDCSGDPWVSSKFWPAYTNKVELAHTVDAGGKIHRCVEEPAGSAYAGKWFKDHCGADATTVEVQARKFDKVYKGDDADMMAKMYKGPDTDTLGPNMDPENSAADGRDDYTGPITANESEMIVEGFDDASCTVPSKRAKHYAVDFFAKDLKQDDSGYYFGMWDLDVIKKQLMGDVPDELAEEYKTTHNCPLGPTCHNVYNFMKKTGTYPENACYGGHGTSHIRSGCTTLNGEAVVLTETWATDNCTGEHHSLGGKITKTDEHGVPRSDWMNHAWWQFPEQLVTDNLKTLTEPYAAPDMNGKCGLVSDWEMIHVPLGETSKYARVRCVKRREVDPENGVTDTPDLVAAEKTDTEAGGADCHFEEGGSHPPETECYRDGGLHSVSAQLDKHHRVKWNTELLGAAWSSKGGTVDRKVYDVGKGEAAITAAWGAFQTEVEGMMGEGKLTIGDGGVVSAETMCISMLLGSGMQQFIQDTTMDACDYFKACPLGTANFHRPDQCGRYDEFLSMGDLKECKPFDGAYAAGTWPGGQECVNQALIGALHKHCNIISPLMYEYQQRSAGDGGAEDEAASLDKRNALIENTICPMLSKNEWGMDMCSEMGVYDMVTTEDEWA